MGSICHIIDRAPNRGKLSQMDPEWSPGAVKKAPNFQPCLDFDCARSRGQEGPPVASSGRNWPSGRGRQNQLLCSSIGAPRFGVGGMAQPLNNTWPWVRYGGVRSARTCMPLPAVCSPTTCTPRLTNSTGDPPCQISPPPRGTLGELLS